MYYRVENGSLIEAPEKNLKIFIANPTDEQYQFLGYSNEIIEDKMPEVLEGSDVTYMEYYEQIDGVIYKHYKEVKHEELTEENEVV